MTGLRRCLAAAVACTTVTLGVAASAETVDYARLPKASLPLLRDVGEPAPARIAPTSRTAGFHPVAMSGGSFVQIAPTPEEAARLQGLVHETDRSEPSPLVCYSLLDDRTHRTIDDAVPEVTSLRQRLSLPGKGSNEERILLVRSEKLVRGSRGSARLVVTDAWVDTTTLGTRRLRDFEVPLRRVASGPNDMAVLAARSADAVTFVVHRPGDDARGFGSSMSIQANDVVSAHSDCGHVVVTLRATELGGQTATIRSDAQLLRDSRGQVEVPNAARLAELRVAFEEAPDDDGLPEVVRRQLAVHLSVSRTSSDRVPVVSTTFAWPTRAPASQ